MNVTIDEIKAFKEVCRSEQQHELAAYFRIKTCDLPKEDNGDIDMPMGTEEEKSLYWLIKNAPLFLHCCDITSTTNN